MTDAWQPIASAPRDGTVIQAVIPGHGSDNMICWQGVLLDEDGEDWGCWTFAMEEQEPPPCWTDGWCWASNEDGERSAWPIMWKPAAPHQEEAGE